MNEQVVNGIIVSGIYLLQFFQNYPPFDVS